MNVEYSISKIERVLIVTFGFLAFALFATGIIGEAVQSYNYSVVEHQKELARQAGAKDIISFATHGWDYSIPLFHLILLPILMTLIRLGRYILSATLTLLYMVLLAVSVGVRLDGRDGWGTKDFFKDPWVELWIKTSFNDYFAAFVIVVLLIWQATILWRLFLNSRRNMEKK